MEPTRHDDIIADRCRRLAVQSRTSERLRRRRLASRYRRDIRLLLYWTFPPSRAAVIQAGVDQENPAATRALCARLYCDLQNAKALPEFYRRRRDRIAALHDLFTAECYLYGAQCARANAQSAMNGFLQRLAV